MRIDQATARRALLAAQGLLEPPPRDATRQDVLKAIRRMGVLQIDTINVVARSPYFVLWSRLGSFRPEWLDELVARGDLFEFWSHAACILPIEDYPLYQDAMEHGFPRHRAWLDEHPEVAARVRALILERGEVKSSDFKSEATRVTGWWDWKPERTALECLFIKGEIMVARRERFQRVFASASKALRGRTLPPPLSAEAARREKLVRAAKHLGVAKGGWLPDYYRLKKTGADAVVRNLCSTGALAAVEVEGWDEPGYVHPENLGILNRVKRGTIQPAVTTFLMPFDPVVWDRKRGSELFGFDYVIEVYTPSHKRQYGYLTLPILHKDQLIGRLDAKAHRKERRFEVRALHLESGIELDDEMARDVASALRRCADWHDTPEISISGQGDFAGLVGGVL